MKIDTPFQCSKCSAENGFAAKFCSTCGAKITVADEPISSSQQSEDNFADSPTPKHSRKKIALYGAIAVAILTIGALLTPYPGMILDNYRHIRKDLKDDDSIAQASLNGCSIRHAGLQPNANASPRQASVAASIINGEPRKDYYFDTEFGTARTITSALVYNAPSSERGLLLYECPSGLELKGRWVRGGTDGSERWLRLTMSRYVRDDAFAPNAIGEAEKLQRANQQAASADASANAGVTAATTGIAATPFAGSNDMVGSDLFLTPLPANLSLIDDGRPKCDIFHDDELKDRVGAGE